LTQTEPPVTPVQPEKAKLLELIFGGLGDALGTRAAVLAGRPAPDSVLEKLRQRREEEAERGTAQRREEREEKRQTRLTRAQLLLDQGARETRKTERSEERGERAATEQTRRAERTEDIAREDALKARQTGDARFDRDLRLAEILGVDPGDLDTSTPEGQRALLGMVSTESQRRRDELKAAKPDESAIAVAGEINNDLRELMTGGPLTGNQPLPTYLANIQDPATRVAEAKRIREQAVSLARMTGGHEAYTLLAQRRAVDIMAIVDPIIREAEAPPQEKGPGLLERLLNPPLRATAPIESGRTFALPRG
jgi:hypothetical protein